MDYINDTLYNVFLEELNALEKFRMSYSSVHSADLLGRDDPDVRRLIEAMAFFSARTRLSALQNINKTRRRLFDQYFSFLLAGLPSMGILQCSISGRLTEPFTLPKDSEIIATTNQGKQAMFRTLHDMSVLPIFLKKTEMLQAPEGFRILLHFHSPYPRNDSIDLFSLYLNYLNNYHASLRFQYALQKHLRQTTVCFDDNFSPTTAAVPCPYFMGSPLNPDATVNGDQYHPLEKVRSFFHFPQKELYLNFKIPAPPRNWTSFTICMDMDRKWPRNFNINRDVFQPFTVPIVNQKQSMAQAILCDGTKDQYPICYPDPKKKFVLHSILGVFEITKDGLSPLKPGIIAGGSGSYEVEQFYEQGLTYLLLNLPEAFANPKKIAVEALWSQPWFSEMLSQELTVFPYSKNIEGVSWEMFGEMRSHQENSLRLDGDGLLKVLSLQKKPVFNLDEVMFLLKAMGSLDKSPFQNIPPLLQKLDVVSVPSGKKSGGLKHIYQIRVKEVDDSTRPLVEMFLKYLLLLLQACSANAMVALKVQIAGSEETLEFE